jgi:hypothetical protein
MTTTTKTFPIYETMSGPELVQAYNELASKLGQPEVTGRFSTRAVGIKRCQDLAARFNDLVDLAIDLAQDEPAQDEPAQDEPAQEASPGDEDLFENLPKDPVAAAEQLRKAHGEPDPAPGSSPDRKEPQTKVENKIHAEFGDPGLPCPEQKREEVKAQAPTQKAKPSGGESKKAEKAGPKVTRLDVSDHQAVFKAFQRREGTNKAKLIMAMIKAMGKPFTLKDLLVAAYGDEQGGTEGGVLTVIKGLGIDIDKFGLPLKFVKTRVGGSPTVTLIYTGETSDETSEETSEKEAQEAQETAQEAQGELQGS